MQYKFFLFLAVLFFSTILQAEMNNIEKIKQEITEQLSKGWENKPQEQPVIVLIGGYSGSGKSELTKAIHSSYESVIISLDVIRQALLDREEIIDGVSFNWEIVRDVYQNLLKAALVSRMNIIMDTNAHVEKIREIELVLKQEGVDQIYQKLKICLNPPYETLVARVRSREKIYGVHQGTEEELKQSFASKKLDLNDYEIVINNNEITFDEEWQMLDVLFRRRLQLRCE
jgi:predicted kinase